MRNHDFIESKLPGLLISTLLAAAACGGSSGMLAPDGGAEPTVDSGQPVASVCPGGPYAASPLPSANPVAERVQGGLGFTEGPVWVEDLGALLFSNMIFDEPNPPPLNGPRADIHKLVPGVGTEVFIERSATNGLGIAPDGTLLACTHDTRSVSRIDVMTKEQSTIADRYMDKRFNSPNDVVIRSDGNVYFSDPDWQLSQTSELPMAVYRVAPDGAVSVVDTMNKPNGVALSPDQSTLYAGAIDGLVRAYALDASGAPGPAQEFATVTNAGGMPVGTDGMGVDCAGNLYVAAEGGVHVFAPDGQKLGLITGTGGFASNAAFGGPERKTLYITAGDSVYSIDLAIPGYPY